MAQYGPFYRLRSETQTDADAIAQARSEELWGKSHRWSDIPQVQAYRGPLPTGEAGIEFATDVADDKGTVPNKPRWTGPRDGVRVDGDFAKIAIEVLKIVP